MLKRLLLITAIGMIQPAFADTISVNVGNVNGTSSMLNSIAKPISFVLPTFDGSLGDLTGVTLDISGMVALRDDFNLHSAPGTYPNTGDPVVIEGFASLNLVAFTPRNVEIASYATTFDRRDGGFTSVSSPAQPFDVSFHLATSTAAYNTGFANATDLGLNIEALTYANGSTVPIASENYTNTVFGSTVTETFTYTAHVPEPASLSVVAFGLVALGLAIRKRRA